jgi:hypothetical protein
MKKDENVNIVWIIAVVILVLLGLIYLTSESSGKDEPVISEEGLEVYRERFLVSCEGLNKYAEIINLQADLIKLLNPPNDTDTSLDEPFPIFDCDILLAEIDRQAQEK